MKRILALFGLLAGLAGWGASSALAGKYMSQAWGGPKDGAYWGPRYAAEVPGVIGPWGQPVHAFPTGLNSSPAASMSGQDTSGADLARNTLLKQYPPQLLEQVGVLPPGVSGVTTAGFNNRLGSNPGLQLTGGQLTLGNEGEKAAMTAVPNNPVINGVPGVAPPGPPGAVAALGALTGGGQRFSGFRTEVRFVGPAGMKISWYAPRADGKSGFTTQYLEAPARYNFLQSSIYRLKLSDIPNRAGVDLYPTLEVMACNAKTTTFLAHSAVPISFTEEDFEQVAAGNFVVKVIYLPDPQYQDLAATGPDEVVSSRLEPGVDPILEAKRRGTILAVVRLGNIDLEAPNTPSMDAPDAAMVRYAQAMQQQQQQQMQMYAQQQQMMQQQNMMRGMPGMPGQPNMAGMMGPGMGMMPGMMPPGMGMPGMMPTMPGAAPQGSMAGQPAVMTPGMMAPGMVPPGMMAPGMVPPGMMPPGGMTPGMMPMSPQLPTSTPAARPGPLGQLTPGSELGTSSRPTLAELASTSRGSSR